MLLLVTTTKGRPKALAALQKWVAAQTTEEFHWLIVCDDWDNYKFPKASNISVIKRESGGDTLPSLCHNWLTALDWIGQHDKYDAVAVLEDDDYYAPGYLRETKELLKKGELVGWNEDAYYYVLSRKMRKMHNQETCSLACTAFKRPAIPFLRECCTKGDVFIDTLLWENYKGKKVIADNFTGIQFGSREIPKLNFAGNVANEHPRHVGMKEPWHGGEEGLSSAGHDQAQGGGPDVHGDVLKRWIGEEDAKFYLSFTRDVDGPKTGKPYPPGKMIPLPIETGM